MATVEELLSQRVARFLDRVPDWDAFADARVEGYRRAQHRFIGTGASGKQDARVIPADRIAHLESTGLVSHHLAERMKRVWELGNEGVHPDRRRRRNLDPILTCFADMVEGISRNVIK